MSKNLSQPSKRVCLGKIASAHGVRGLVKIIPYGEDPSLIETLGPVFTSENGNKTVSVTFKNPMGKYILAELEGVFDRSGAEDIKGTELFIDKDSLPEIEEDGTYYFEDLIGLKAVDTSGDDAGKIIAVHNFGAGDLLEIQPPGGEAYLLPFTDDYVPTVTEDSVTITPIEMDG